MTDAALIYCVGATKAGTSWLYRYLHAHDGVTVRAVKEAHYWNTDRPGALKHQLAALDRKAATLRTRQAEAADEGKVWKVGNLGRQIAEVEALIAVLSGDRAGHAGYRDWLFAGAEGLPVADITPAYALLPAVRYREMAAVSPVTRFLFLLRDPIDRLWSHVRMIAKRQPVAGQGFEARANAILSEVVAGDARHAHIVTRGDYRDTLTRLRAAVPARDLLTAFMERMVTGEALGAICAFLGIAERPAPEKRVHEGLPARMDESLRPRVAAALKEQYDWVAENVGPLPQRWQDNLQRALA